MDHFLSTQGSMWLFFSLDYKIALSDRVQLNSKTSYIHYTLFDLVSVLYFKIRQKRQFKKFIALNKNIPRINRSLVKMQFMQSEAK